MGLGLRLFANRLRSQIPDVNLVASDFRKRCRGKSIPLDAATIENTFDGFCRKLLDKTDQSSSDEIEKQCKRSRLQCELDPNYDGLLTISDHWSGFHFPGE